MARIEKALPKPQPPPAVSLAPIHTAPDTRAAALFRDLPIARPVGRGNAVWFDCDSL
jgi:hypothetical protein